jgi:hypothetical protein
LSNTQKRTDRYLGAVAKGLRRGRSPISPQKAFYRKLMDIIVGNYMRMVEQILGESQEVSK